jgi:hypothetical protein
MRVSRRKPNVHLLTVVGGGDSILLGHLVEHYRALGIESFFVIRHAESTADPDYEPIAHYARQSGISLYDTWLGPWDGKIHERRTAAVLAEHPDDWFVVADSDEFQIYDRPLPELIDLCESRGHTHVSGCYIDRLASDGSLPEITAAPLWAQFTLGGALTGTMLGTPLKIGLALGRQNPAGSHHGGPGRTGLPRAESYVQVHHFKWTASLLERTRRRVERYETGAWRLAYNDSLNDARRLLAYMERHGGRVDVTDERFHLREIGDRYGDHPLWTTIAAEAQRWAVPDSH